MMNVVRGRKTEQFDLSALQAAIPPSAHVVVDLGTGDGRWAYRYAAEHPAQFVIAIDPVAENLREISGKAAKKPGKGGLGNLLFVMASVEMLPDELNGIADEVYVTLPWGSLMRGLALAEAGVLAGVASLAKHGATVRIVLNTRIFDDPVPNDVRDLPELSPEYARDVLGPAYAAAGLRIAARWMDADEVALIGTTWAKKLSHNRPPRSLCIVAERT